MHIQRLGGEKNSKKKETYFKVNTFPAISTIFEIIKQKRRRIDWTVTLWERYIS